MGGSVLLAMEWARTNKNRGLLAAWPQFGGPAGLFLANLAVLFFSWLSGDDFLLYGQVTGLVFGRLFFPQSDPLVGVLQAFAVFFVGFLGRPIGAYSAIGATASDARRP